MFVLFFSHHSLRLYTQHAPTLPSDMVPPDDVPQNKTESATVHRPNRFQIYNATGASVLLKGEVKSVSLT